MDNYNNFYNGQPQGNNSENYQFQNSQNYQSNYQPQNYQAITQAPTQPIQQPSGLAPTQSQNVYNEVVPTPNYANDSYSFQDPNSFVPQTLRQYNTHGRYFTTRGRDKIGQEVKFFFTQEERDYLTKFGISAQQFYNIFQSKLGGELVKGDPTRSPTYVGPSFQNPDSFIPGDMRSNCPERNYFQYTIQDEKGTMKRAFLTKEEIDFTRTANIDISTYINVYQSEFNYDKGQMEKSANQTATQTQSSGSASTSIGQENSQS